MKMTRYVYRSFQLVCTPWPKGVLSENIHRLDTVYMIYTVLNIDKMYMQTAITMAIYM